MTRLAQGVAHAGTLASPNTGSMVMPPTAARAATKAWQLPAAADPESSNSKPHGHDVPPKAVSSAPGCRGDDSSAIQPNSTQL